MAALFGAMKPYNPQIDSAHSEIALKQFLAANNKSACCQFERPRKNPYSSLYHWISPAFSHQEPLRAYGSK